MMNHSKKVFVAGHKGMVGSAIVRKLKSSGFNNLVLRSHSELDLSNQAQTEAFFDKERPAYVFLAAAHVGGINANANNLSGFLYDNLMIEMNVIHSSCVSGVEKLLFLGSSCIYPRLAAQPIKESSLLTGALEPTNEGYALAKIAGLRFCSYLNQEHNMDFISCMPTNLYGPNDNYDPQTSHVLPAMIRRFHEAKMNDLPSVTIWGTGTPLREFLHVDDLADACLFLMENYSGTECVNIGSGEEVSIKDLAYTVAQIVGYEGEILMDPSKPDGTPRKLLDLSKINKLGWNSSIKLEDGIRLVYEDYCSGSYT